MIKACFALLILTTSLWSQTLKENLKLMPYQCNTLVCIDISKALASPLLKPFLTDKTHPLVMDLASIGIIPEKINHIVIGIDTSKVAINEKALNLLKTEAIAVTTMKKPFNIKMAIEAAKMANIYVSESVIKGMPVINIKKNSILLAFTQLSDLSIAIGSPEMLKKTILLHEGSSSDNIITNTSLTGLIKNQEKLFWAIGLFPDTSQLTPSKSNQIELLKKVQSFALTSSLETFVKINLKFNCANEDVASQLSIMTQLALGMLSSSSKFPISMDKIKTKTIADEIIFNIELDREGLGKINNFLKQQ
jgi:hypothetical protein